MTTEQSNEILDPRAAAFAESAANLAGMLRGLVSRWETVDFSVSANCFDLDERMQAWHQTKSGKASEPVLPAAYWRL